MQMLFSDKSDFNGYFVLWIALLASGIGTSLACRLG
jgi:hypothetical protein